MATEFKGISVIAKPFPFQQQASFNASRYSTVPWGQAIVDMVDTTPAIGAGDDGLIKIDVDLPSDYVALLRNLQLNVSSSAGTVSWDEALVGMAYQTPGGPYKTSVTEFPELTYVWFQMVGDQQYIRDRFASTSYYTSFMLGYNVDAGVEVDNRPIATDATDPTQLPLWIPPTIDATFKSRQMVFYIKNKNASQQAGNIMLRMSLDLFTLDQAYTAAVMSSPRVFS
jgi:hypothetical protein